jgi:parallel beta-helix repeat protein
MRFLVIPVAVFSFATSGFSAAYYFALSGDDNRTATAAQNPATPWKSLSKISSVTLQPGDHILLQRGDRFRGQLSIMKSGTAAAPITVEPWGSGTRDAPTISGAVIVGDWQLPAGSSTYEANLGGNRPEQLFLNMVPMTLARSPNTGYFTVESVVNDSTFTSKSLQTSADLTGASIHIKSARWSLDARTIIKHDRISGQVVLNRKTNYHLAAGWGFFVNNHKSLLDAPGEWYYDPALQKIYARFTSSPATATVEASVFPYGIFGGNESYVQIRDLRISHQASAGISFGSGVGITISNCRLYNAMEYGIKLSSDHSSIQGSVVRGPVIFGMQIGGTNSLVKGCSISDVGQLFRFGRNGMGGANSRGISLKMSGDYDTASYNHVDSSGYVGINFGGQHSRIERNEVSTSCMTLDDGAGIYTAAGGFDRPGGAFSVVTHNIVRDGVGAIDGQPNRPLGAVRGIYLDNESHDITLDSNILINNERGIWINHGRRHTITGNVCYRNWSIQLGINSTSGDSNGTYPNQIHNNILYSFTAKQTAINMNTSFANPSTITNNYMVVEGQTSVVSSLDAATLWTLSYPSVDTAILHANPRGQCFFNNGTKSAALSLGSFSWRKVPGPEITGSITLAPFTSMLLVRHNAVLMGATSVLDIVARSSLKLRPGANGTIQCAVTMLRPGKVFLNILDARGRLVESTSVEGQAAGEQSIPVHARFAPGMYLGILEAGALREETKLLVN